MQYINQFGLDSFIFEKDEDEDVLNYLKSKRLIEWKDQHYSITETGEKHLIERYFEELIGAEEKEERLIHASEQAAKAANESAKSAKEANRLASVSNSKSTTANWVAGFSASFTLLTLLYYLLAHFNII